tara:strand:+ start:91 stop:1074 length:984 start_codon:yes stop_codon:yes gene_type:complete
MEEEYDSDTEYVPDFDMVDLNDFQLNKGTELMGGSWGAVVEHINDDDLSFQFALPQFKIGDNLNISEASKNGFLTLNLDSEDSKHEEFRQWIVNVEQWLVDQFVKNHNEWFGHMWQSGGPLAGRPLPPANIIKEMYHPIIGDDNSFVTRVHIKKGKYDVQCMDSDQNMIDINEIKNTNIVPLVELKGIFMKPRGYNPDIVLRGLVTVSEEANEEELSNSGSNEYCLFHSPETETQYAYVDYATDDGDTDSEVDVDELTENIEGPTIDVEESEEFKESNQGSNSKVSPENPYEETIKELMRATEEAKMAATNAEAKLEAYQKSVSPQQ